MVLSPRTDVEPVDPSLVVSFISVINLDMYIQAATVTVLIYDAIITMDKEARYFWRIPRKTVNFVYFVNRYIGIFAAVSALYSRSIQIPDSWDSVFALKQVAGIAINWIRNIADWAIIVLMDYILMIRVLALFSQDIILSIILKMLLVLEAAFKFGLDIYLTSLSHVVIGEFAKKLTFCGEDGLPPWQWTMVNWIIPIVYGSVLMILALYKAADYWKVSAGFKHFTLVKVLLRDQVLYFALAISCSVINIITNRVIFSSPSLGAVLNSLGNPTFLSLLGSRMLFNLKEAGERGQNEGTSYTISSRTISAIDFVDPGDHQRESRTEGITSTSEDA
ncbi:hypothetical protein ACEPAI_1527 [Sanghuangporus weigelae]